ncbi:MAG: hypothetical protein Q4F21_04330 [Lachnospiraceae bacterium]|nr:hypothetical protein [Lachnospiraceae bacterium]
MKKKRLLHIIGDINEDYIREAAPDVTDIPDSSHVTDISDPSHVTDVKKRKTRTWIKWGGAAACFALAFILAIPAIHNLLTKPEKTMVDSILLVEYNNAYYEVIENNPQYLRRKGIETEITKDLAGKHISYLKKESEAERSDYIVSAQKTNMELLDYAPANQEAVKILRDGDKYFAVIFCNYLIDDNKTLPFNEVFRVYGISKANQIKSIVSVKTDNEYQANGTAVTDNDLIASFYNEILTLDRYSEEDFDKIQFTDKDESKSDRYYRQFADDRNDLMIETVDGLKFIISYYPTYDWVNSSLTQTYYKLSPVLEMWIETNLR